MKAIINNTCLYPNFTIQAYIAKPRRQGNLLSVGAIKTINLFNFLHQQSKQYINDHLRPNSEDSNLFVFVEWNELIKNKIQVKTWFYQN